jgi:DNA polymerase-3 subunit chi
LRVDFYQLTRSPVEAVIPKLVEKMLADGERALIVAQDAALLARLDEHLWISDPASFIPHGIAGGGDEAEQPVLLSQTAAPQNGARFLLSADGRYPEGAEAFERVFLLFDDTSIGEARNEWRRLGPPKHYWKQDERGRWVEGP